MNADVQILEGDKYTVESSMRMYMQQGYKVVSAASVIVSHKPDMPGAMPYPMYYYSIVMAREAT